MIAGSWAVQHIAVCHLFREVATNVIYECSAPVCGPSQVYEVLVKINLLQHTCVSLYFQAHLFS